MQSTLAMPAPGAWVGGRCPARGSKERLGSGGYTIAMRSNEEEQNAPQVLLCAETHKKKNPGITPPLGNSGVPFAVSHPGFTDSIRHQNKKYNTQTESAFRAVRKGRGVGFPQAGRQAERKGGGRKALAARRSSAVWGKIAVQKQEAGGLTGIAVPWRRRAWPLQGMKSRGYSSAQLSPGRNNTHQPCQGEYGCLCGKGQCARRVSCIQCGQEGADLASSPGAGARCAGLFARPGMGGFCGAGWMDGTGRPNKAAAAC